MPLLPQTKFKTIPELIILLVEISHKKQLNKLHQIISIKNQHLEFQKSPIAIIPLTKNQNQTHHLTTQPHNNKNHQTYQIINPILKHHQA